MTLDQTEGLRTQEVRESFFNGYSAQSAQDQRRAEKNETSTNSLNLNLEEKVGGREGLEERKVEKEEEEEEGYEGAVMGDFERKGPIWRQRCKFQGLKKGRNE